MSYALEILKNNHENIASVIEYELSILKRYHEHVNNSKIRLDLLREEAAELEDAIFLLEEKYNG